MDYGYNMFLRCFSHLTTQDQYFGPPGPKFDTRFWFWVRLHIIYQTPTKINKHMRKYCSLIGRDCGRDSEKQPDGYTDRSGSQRRLLRSDWSMRQPQSRSQRRPQSLVWYGHKALPVMGPRRKSLFSAGIAVLVLGPFLRWGINNKLFREKS